VGHPAKEGLRQS